MKVPEELLGEIFLHSVRFELDGVDYGHLQFKLVEAEFSLTRLFSFKYPEIREGYKRDARLVLEFERLERVPGRKYRVRRTGEIMRKEVFVEHFYPQISSRSALAKFLGELEPVDDKASLEKAKADRFASRSDREDDSLYFH